MGQAEGQQGVHWPQEVSGSEGRWGSVGQAHGCQGTISDGRLGVVGHEMGQTERLQGSMTSSEREGGRKGDCYW